MNRKGLIRLAGAALLCAAADLAVAQTLEVIPLRHRTAEQVLPASPANLAELRQALEAIYQQAQRLRILVRFDNAAQGAVRDVGASGTISNRGARVVITGQDTGLMASERVDQQLHVPDGGRALISGGFEVMPRVVGSQVTLDIAPQRESGDSVQSAATTVTTRLGAWTELGAMQATGTGGTDSRRIWVKVEEAN